MSGLVNYSSEEDQDDYHKKAGERERTQRSSRGAHDLGAADRNDKRQLKKHYRARSVSSSSSVSNGEHRPGDSKVATPPRKEKYVDDAKSKRMKNTNISHNSSNNSSFNYIDEDKYKFNKRSEKYTRDESRDKRDNRGTKYTKERRNSRERSHDNNNYHEISKNDDKRLNKDYKRDHNKRGNFNSDNYRDDKRFRNDDNKKYSSSNYSKDRSNSSKSRYDDRKSYDDRYNERREEKHRPNEDRRSTGHYNTHSRKEESEYDDRNKRRSNNDERRGGQRSYSDKERTNPYRSTANKHSERRPADDDVKYQKVSDAAEKDSEQHSNIPREHSNETRSNDTKLSPSRGDGPEKKNLPSARNFEALLSLPLSETASKEPSKITVPAIIAASDDPETLQLPTYYNPKVINATKYATQMQKRKLIWGSKKTDDVAAKWGHAQFSQDSDGKVASKFMRLMGIKNAGDTNADDNVGEKLSTSVAPTSTNPDFKTREAMFSTMEQQYEVARQVTHTMRGVGLGFSSQSRPY